MHRPNYNYNYGIPTSVEKPSSLHKPTTYITSTTKPLYQPHHDRSEPQYYIPNQPVKYYPIISHQNSEPSSNLNRTNLSSATESASSFYVNQSKQSRKEFGQRTGEMFEVKSPKSTDNWYNHNMVENNSNTESNLSIITQQQKDRHELGTRLSDTIVDKATEQYISWLYEVFGQFEKTGNVKLLKEINEKLFAEKENFVYERQPAVTLTQTTKSAKNIPTQQLPSTRPKTFNTTSITKLRSQLSTLQHQSATLTTVIHHAHTASQQLEEQLIQQIEIKQGRNLNQSQIRQDNHSKQMQESIIQLEEEISLLQRKNNEVSKNIGNVAFLKEWNMMFEEAKGATKLAVKLRHEIERREDVVKELAGEDPSNNSDARSRKMMSENGDKPQPNFMKKDNRMANDPLLPKPNTLARPVSELPHKFVQKPDSGRSSNDVVIRHLSHSNRFSQSKKTTVNNSVDKTKERKQSYDQKQHSTDGEWKGLAFPGNLKNFGMGFIGKDAYK